VIPPDQPDVADSEPLTPVADVLKGNVAEKVMGVAFLNLGLNQVGHPVLPVLECGKVVCPNTDPNCVVI
jgi:hypothetical protein